MNFKKLRQMLTVKGNGKIGLKKHSISSFLNLHISVKGLVELHQSDEEKVEVEADENLFDYISVVNSGKTLFVTSEAGYRKLDFTNLKVKIFFRQLAKLYIRCDDGNVISRTVIASTTPLEVKIQSIGATDLKLDVPALKMLIQSKGDVTLSGKCANADIKSQAEGNLFAKEMIAESLKIKNMSSGNVAVFANKIISISHYGEGFVHYYGNAVLHDVNQFGMGEVKHMNLETVS
jgi:hypothetical protein